MEETVRDAEVQVAQTLLEMVDKLIEAQTNATKKLQELSQQANPSDNCSGRVDLSSSGDQRKKAALERPPCTNSNSQAVISSNANPSAFSPSNC